VPSPAGDPEDRRQAASMAVGISSAVTSASLTLLGVLAVIVTFTADKYSHLFIFYVLIGVSAMLLICAIIAGVQGTAEILREGASGVWKTKTEKRLFDRQALLAGLALVAVAAAVPVGLSSDRRVDDDRELTRFQRTLDSVADRLHSSDQVVTRLQRRVARLERQRR
jgi:hypothetical protein